MNSFERLCLVFFEEKKNINVSQATLEKYHKVIKPFLSFLNQKDIKTIDAINTLVFKEAIDRDQVESWPFRPANPRVSAFCSSMSSM